MIELKDVRRTYRKGSEEIHALAGVSLRIEPGEFVAVTGPSGSGKSTLMHIIGLLDRPDGGSYTLEGRAVDALHGDELARLRNEKIGFVFQAFHLLPRTTARENVELPLIYSSRADVDGLADRALAAVGLSDRSNHEPGELSGGQQQRVAVARAVVNSPEILLADEPTGNLDPDVTAEILQLLFRINSSGTAVLMATHNHELVKNFGQRILHLRDGRIEEEHRMRNTGLPRDTLEEIRMGSGSPLWGRERGERP